MKETNGDKIYITFTGIGSNVPLEFHRAIVPADEGTVEVTKQNEGSFLTSVTGKISFDLRKQRKMAVIYSSF